jgi:flagellar motor switch protein FliN/FliY
MSDELLNGTLSKEDHNTLSEMTSIAMGAAGSTLGVLLGHDVEITTPEVREYGSLADMDIPFGDEPKSLVLLQYVKGIYATSLFILKNTDARRLAEMMLGTPSDSSGDALNELQTGALSELMNQMMNSAATSLASVIHEPVEINSPEVIAYSSDALAQCLPQVLSEAFTASRMQMKLGSEAPVELIELRVVTEIKDQVARFLAQDPDSGDNTDEADFATEDTTVSLDELLSSAPKQPAVAAASQGAPSGSPRPQPSQAMNVDPVTVRPVEFGSFDHQPSVFGEENKNLELVMDVTLNLTVELGKTELSIKDVLELTRGSVIELDRVAGEPVDLMANGKLIAKGEVVVIEDNFGLRITSIVSPADRLRGL